MPETKIGGGLAAPAWSRALTVFEDATTRVGAKLDSASGSAAAASRTAMGITSLFLPPAALTALVLGLWGLSADLGWAGQFVIRKGLFSHWQVWIGLAGALQAAASLSRRVPPARQSEKTERPGR